MRSGCRLWVLGLVTVGWTALLFYAYVLDISWRPLQHGLIGFGSQERHPHHHCHICCGGGEAKVHHDVHDLLHHRQLPPVPVVVGVMSNGRKQERRSLWRQALLPILERYSGLKPGVDYVLKFIIAEGLTPEEEAAVREENRLYGDLLQVNCVEAYLNLTCKTLEMCRSFVRDYDFGLLFKVDDDTFVRLDRLLPELVRRQNEKALYEGVAMKSQSKPKEETFFPHIEQFLPYNSGSGYILSWDLAQFIAQPPNQLVLKRFRAEDASVGLWVGPFDIRYSEREDFQGWGIDEECPESNTEGLVAVHYFPKEKWRDCAERIVASLSSVSIANTTAAEKTES